MDVSGTEVLGWPIQSGNERFTPGACIPVRRECGVFHRRNKFPFPKSDTKDRRAQSGNGDPGVWEPSPGDKFEVRDQEIFIMISLSVVRIPAKKSVWAASQI